MFSQKILRKVLQGFLASRSWLPAQCLVCLAAITDKNYLCPNCSQALITNTFSCNQCAEPLSIFSHLAKCSSCNKTSPAYTHVKAARLYTGAYKQLVTEFKYQQNLSAGYFILQLLQEELSQIQNKYQLLLVIPGQKKRIRKRGLHAPTWLARRLSLLNNLPFNPQALTRIKNLTSQQKLTKRARWLNPAGSFKANSKLVKGKSLLLIDDVLTTGASCHWAAEELLNQGAVKVDILVAARAPKKEKY